MKKKSPSPDPLRAFAEMVRDYSPLATWLRQDAEKALEAPVAPCACVPEIALDSLQAENDQLRADLASLKAERAKDKTVIEWAAACAYLNVPVDGSLVDAIAASIARAHQKGREKASVEAERAWQPIETAPKDGTLIDVWCSSPDGVEQWRLTACWWHAPNRTWRNHHGHRGGATHWMPLPPPPASSERGKAP